MRHTVITIDVATVGEWDPFEVLMKFDAVLRHDEFEFEDWKVRTHVEERPI